MTTTDADGPVESCRRKQRAPRRPNFELAVVLLAASCALGCNPSATRRQDPPQSARTPASRGDDQITQVSIINALLLSRYDGVAPVSELLAYGDFGLGTFDHLDGEMIVLDGEVWQAKGDGAVVRAAPTMTTPFAVVTPFAADRTFPCPEAQSLESLDARLDEQLAAANSFIALKVDVDLSTITLRSVPRQDPPYRPLAEVTKEQSVWTHHDLRGVLVAIRCPAWTEGVNVPGFHWHFLSEDRTIGGHVIDCVVRSGTVECDFSDSWHVLLESVAGDSQDLGKDLRRELEQVERPRGQN